MSSPVESPPQNAGEINQAGSSTTEAEKPPHPAPSLSPSAPSSSPGPAQQITPQNVSSPVTHPTTGTQPVHSIDQVVQQQGTTSFSPVFVVPQTGPPPYPEAIPVNFRSLSRAYSRTTSVRLDPHTPSPHALSENKTTRRTASGRIISGEDVFEIPAKNPTPESLRKWRKAALVLNATRRFRYTAKRDDLNQARTSIRMSRELSMSALKRPSEIPVDNGPFPEGFNISAPYLVRLVQEKKTSIILHLGGVPAISSLLQTNISEGIAGNEADIQTRKTAFGSNTYPRQPPKSLFYFLWDACKDTTLIILMVCALLSLIFGIRSHGWKEGWYDGVSILIAISVVICVTATSDYRQALQFLDLNEEKRNIQVQVVRGGRRVTVSIFDLVVGDVVVLNIGDQIPADGLFAQGHSLTINESSMTGESEPVQIDRTRPFLLSGCKVEDGVGTMVVTGVGMNTEWGQLMAAIGEDNGEETPLQVRLNGVATLIGKVGLTVAVLVLIILIAFYFCGHSEGSNHSGKFKRGVTKITDAVNSVVDAFAIAITIIVVAVPEGLPLAVTLTLAYSMQKMMNDKALVRRLAACETMGGATCICSDKTGTLTLNLMTVVKTWVGGEFRDPVSDLKTECVADFHKILLESIALNSNGSVFKPSDQEPEVTGSPTEKAVLKWGIILGMEFALVKSQVNVLHVETFNSTKKRAGIAVRSIETNKVRVHWKGAAEIILGQCQSIALADNSIAPMSTEKRKELLKVIESMAAESLRCIAFAYIEVKEESVPTTAELLAKWKIPESSLCLLSLVGIKDPCRPGVPQAVALCQKAGIKVRMVTGDNIVTAKAIAVECGILQGGLAIEGETFRNYTDEERKELLPQITVMARSSPSDKLLMVKTLREMEHVVAVTGDGTNDAPALHEADIGLAMGISGTEVAKDSADIVILDDDFTSVVKVVRWGRSVYSNIQKFIQFQLTVNTAALALNFIAAVSSGDVPLNAVQLLWVNLIMDTLGALALATEHPTDDLMERDPVHRKDSLITPVMWRNILTQAAYQLLVLLILKFKGISMLNLHGADAEDTNNTIIFNSFVICQLFNEVNARKPTKINIFKGFFKNRMFVAILFFTALLQFLIVHFLYNFFSTVRIGWKHWLLCVVIGFISWPIAVIVKFFPIEEIVENIRTRRSSR